MLNRTQTGIGPEWNRLGQGLGHRLLYPAVLKSLSLARIIEVSKIGFGVLESMDNLVEFKEEETTECPKGCLI